jgi:hypothetical protein
MGDPLKDKRIIGAMYLDVITGSVDTRNQYMNVLISHIETRLRMERLNPAEPSLVRFRTALHKTVDMIVRNYTLGKLPLADTRREREIKQLEAYFDRFVIKVDAAAVSDPKTIEEIELLQDMETLEYARNITYAASEAYSMALTGDREGFAKSFNALAMVINLITPIIYRYNLVDISESDYSNAARAAARRVESGKGESK